MDILVNFTFGGRWCVRRSAVGRWGGRRDADLNGLDWPKAERRSELAPPAAYQQHNSLLLLRRSCGASIDGKTSSSPVSITSLSCWPTEAAHCPHYLTISSRMAPAAALNLRNAISRWQIEKKGQINPMCSVSVASTRNHRFPYHTHAHTDRRDLVDKSINKKEEEETNGVRRKGRERVTGVCRAGTQAREGIKTTDREKLSYVRSGWSKIYGPAGTPSVRRSFSTF